MGIYIRQDSPVYWLLFEGYRTPSGRPVREATKIRHDAPTARQRTDAKEQARIRYHERLGQLARGDAQATKSKRTFAEQAAWFVEHRLPRRKGREREARVIPKLVTVFGAYPLTAIKPALVTELWITPRLTHPTVITAKKHTAARTVSAGPRTVNREVEVLKTILSSAVPDHLEASPLFGMPGLKTTTPKRRLLTSDEESRLLAVMEPDDTAFFLIAIDSLVRLTDILDLKRQDDQGDHLWIGDPKANGGFPVALSTRARRALNIWYRHPAYDRSDTYIFQRRRGARLESDRANHVRKRLAVYCRLADVPYGRAKGGITFHWATRRTGATRMLTRGNDLGTVQKVGRWKTADIVLGIYHELIDDQARRAVNSVGRRK